jgi:protein involved in polysaccharide export with SLBB domain
VNVDVQQYAGQYVTVMGEVASPGRVALIAPTSSVKSWPKPAA